jgi:glycosyltransferase involved in cell wall biosynthesis
MVNSKVLSEAPLVSLVTPVFNEEGNVEELYSQTVKAFQIAGVRYEFIFVDNGSTDNSLQIIKKLRKDDPAVRYISLSRNFGHQGGLLAGMSEAKGDVVITIDADLQQPPSLIPEMIRLWQEGNNVVYTIKRNYKIFFVRLLLINVFYKLISKISGLSLSFGQSDFRLLDRKVLNILLSIPEQPLFLRGLVEWVGFRQAKLEYDVAERYSGKSKFSLLSLFGFAIDGITAFTSFPLRVIFFTGVFIASFSFLYTLFAVACGLLSKLGYEINVPPGWSAIASAVTFLGGIQLLSLGIIGEYIGRIHSQGKQRPLFIIKEDSESSATSDNRSKL